MFFLLLFVFVIIVIFLIICFDAISAVKRLCLCRSWNPGMRFGGRLKTGPKANCDSWKRKFPWAGLLRLSIELCCFKFGVDPELGLGNG